MIEIHRLNTLNNEIIMEMSENGKTICQAKAISHTDGTAEIISLGNGYDMGKALLNAIDLMGIKDVFCKDLTLKNVLTALKFKDAGDRFILNLEGYFTGGC
ncbi:MAG: hypothetical protein IJM94_02815 [Clostridia bacterium]|nr:hypothetical protein [Clostridia bacterium]